MPHNPASGQTPAPRYDFASDNTAPIAPEALDGLVRVNSGYAAPYGADPVTAQAADLVRKLLDADAEVRFVASGTAANAIALATLCRPFESVLAHQYAHILTEEAGAPVFFGHGLGIVGLPGASGRIDLQALETALALPEAASRQSPAALSLTNTTDFGTVYAAETFGALTSAAKAKGLGVHLDGARIANAAAAGFAMNRIAGLGVDILSLGGAKAGMTPSEAVVIFDRKLARRFDTCLKQCGQMLSKGRYLAAPFVGMLEDGAFMRHAAHANAMAARLAAGQPFALRHSPEANGVYVEMSDAALGRLRALGWVALRVHDGSVRFMCSWATTREAVDELCEALTLTASAD